MAVTIRRAQSGGLDQLVALWQELVDFHAELDLHFALAPDAATRFRVSMSQWLQDENCRVLIAEDKSERIGFINALVREMPPVYVEKYHGMIADVIVTARCRRQGVGEMLYRGIVEWFRERGVNIIELSAAVRNPVALAFWRRMGFEDYMLRLRGEL